MLPVIVIGGGGHAQVLIDALLEQSRTVLGYTVSGTPPVEKALYGVPCLGGDDVLDTYTPGDIELVIGVGSTGIPLHRANLYERYRLLGYTFATVVHHSAVISRRANLGQGVQVMAGAVVQAGARIGENVIVNTRTAVDHDCEIESHVHLAPGCTLSGAVCVGTMTHVGTAATVIQGVHIGTNCVVGAGSVIIRDVQDNTVVVGVPGRERMK